MQEVYADPQIQAREMVVELDHPRAGHIKNIGVPVKLSDTPGKIRTPAPLLGQHTKEVLAEIGYSSDEIAAFEEEGVLG
jgi:crotonobetainyl-CoA:carnitine CoA-transferase CaiB-like acyl-CoA transferase